MGLFVFVIAIIIICVLIVMIIMKILTIIILHQLILPSQNVGLTSRTIPSSRANALLVDAFGVIWTNNTAAY